MMFSPGLTARRAFHNTLSQRDLRDFGRQNGSGLMAGFLGGVFGMGTIHAEVLGRFALGFFGSGFGHTLFGFVCACSKSVANAKPFRGRLGFGRETRLHHGEGRFDVIV
jgi:hypothetical protein